MATGADGQPGEVVARVVAAEVSPGPGRATTPLPLTAADHVPGPDRPVHPAIHITVQVGIITNSS